MSKFKKKKDGGLPAISTASLPDIVFMLLFFFMVATVLRDTSLFVENQLPPADQVEKLKKDRTMFIYAGSPKEDYQGTYGKEGRIQINDTFSSIEAIQSAVEEYKNNLPEEFKSRMVVGLKVDEGTNSGIVFDIKEELRKANALKVIYVANAKNDDF